MCWSDDCEDRLAILKNVERHTHTFPAILLADVYATGIVAHVCVSVCCSTIHNSKKKKLEIPNGKFVNWN